MSPIIKGSDKILNLFSVFFRVGGVSLFPYIILRPYYLSGKYREESNYVSPKLIRRGEVIINHETIHFQQALELLVVPFYVLYVLNWFINLFFYWNFTKAYKNICFEREANKFEEDDDYLDKRKRYCWLKYIFSS